MSSNNEFLQVRKIQKFITGNDCKPHICCKVQFLKVRRRKTIHLNPTCIWQQIKIDQSHEGCFAGTRRANQKGKFTLLDGQAQIINPIALLVGVGYILEFNHEKIKCVLRC